MTRREKGEFAAGGGGGDSGDLGIELEGSRERAKTSSSSARDRSPGCLVLPGGKCVPQPALRARASGLKGWLTRGGGVASMAAVTGKGLEGPVEGVGKPQLRRLGGPEEA